MGFLLLEDGCVFNGDLMGSKKSCIGEIVFNTGMTGYQEVMTDPSYCGQIVTFTFPLIGNYGINDEWEESVKPALRGIVIHEACSTPNHYQSQGSLDDFLVKNNITAITGIDTRELTKKIRIEGTMAAMITPEMPDYDYIETLKNFSVKKPVNEVTSKSIYTIPGRGLNIGVMDFGIKRGILRSLSERDLNITVFPALTDARTILSYDPDALVLSNGPGDPKDNIEGIETCRNLFTKLPIFGICLGHQLLAIARGADTVKMKYGHRGLNHPVISLKGDRTYITSQNHGYAVTYESLTDEMQVTFKNVNDNTIEGIKYKDHPVTGVQFHPEASPGPQDTRFLFDEFIETIKSGS